MCLAVCFIALAACGSAGNDPAEDLTADASPPAPSSPWNEIEMPPGTFHDQVVGYRTDTIDIPLGPGGELEYKLQLDEGAAIVYEWNALNLTNPEELWSEFHGHTERGGNAQGDLMFYRTAAGGNEKGSLIAPFTGIHGWYLRNDSAENITVRLNVAGYYTLIGQ